MHATGKNTHLLLLGVVAEVSKMFMISKSIYPLFTNKF